MREVLRFLILGLGTGGLYALLSMGVVLVYRGSGIVNFAASGFALFGAAIFYELRGGPLGAVGSAVVAIVATAALGLVTQAFIMGPMRRSSPVVRVVATLAVLSALEEGGLLRYGSNTLFVTGVLPSATIHVFGTAIGENYLTILGIALVLTVALTFVYRRTRFGLLTTAVSENEVITAAQGWSPAAVAAGNWALGGALAGAAGVLLVPITGLSATSLALTIVPALAASLLGGFSSFSLTFLGALLIGVLESEADRYVTAPGWSDAVPFLAIIVVLTLRGRALPLRSHLTDRLPRIGFGQIHWGRVLIALAVGGATLSLWTDAWAAAVTITASYAILCLSMVVVTGLCGQLSLAQYAMAGVGAFVSGRVAAVYHLPFPLALLIGVVVTVPIGMILALPALRVRGVNLAVLTMGLAVVVSSVVLNNPSYTGGTITGTVVSNPTIFGFSVYSVLHPVRYAWVSLVLLVVSGLVVANVRRGRSGRRMIAVRDNERAAASLGINVRAAKLYSFGLAAGLAALAGVLIAFTNSQIEYSQFDVFSGINLLLISVIGGIGFVLGGVVGGIIVADGIIQEVLSHFFSVGNWFAFVSALLVLVTLLTRPDGLALSLGESWAGPAAWLRRIIRRPTAAPLTEQDRAAAPATRQRRLQARLFELKDVTVRFGQVTAVDGVSLRVEPGQVVGLIGPNGAGKTTVIDAATGYVRALKGRVEVDGRPIHQLPAFRRAALGVTRSFQSLELFEDLTVGDNLRAASDRRDVTAYFSDLVHPGRSPLPEVAQAAVDEFRLADVVDRPISGLSYAQRRLVAIARAVATQPSILLLDEPAAGLDDVSTRELGALIRRLADDWGMGVLLIEHDVSMVMETCDRVVVLNFGKVIAEGPPETIRHDPAVVAAYLGQAVPAEKLEGAEMPTTTGSRP